MIQRIRVQPIELGLVPELSHITAKPAGPSFSRVLDQILQGADELHKTSPESQRRALESTVQDIRRVMLAAEEAGIAFEVIVELRNKLLETYQELMRMQV